jgi:DMSO/TMAO reductase YedYZ molybdopterin-dependent catalytic subunit
VLTIDGQVEHVLSLSYADLLKYPQISRLAGMECVEGWKYKAKWTGVELGVILKEAGVKPGVRSVVFQTADVPEDYSYLNLDDIFKNQVMLALKDNDVTLTADKGFPFQVVAGENHKWANWVTRIELSTEVHPLVFSDMNAYDTVFCHCHTSKPWWWPFPWWPG